MTPESPKDWRARVEEFGAALRNVPRAFALLWEADPSSTVLMAVLALASGILPLAQAWVTKLIVDSVFRALQEGVGAPEGFRRTLPYLAVEFGLLLASSVNTQVRILVEKFVNHRLGHLINTRIIRKALELDLRYFEDSEFYDKMQNARRQSEWRAMGTIHGGFLLVQNLLTLGSSMVVLLAFSPWVALVLFGAAIPAFLVQCRYSALAFRLESWRAPETRSMTYLEQVLTQDTSVKEVKLFSLGAPLLERYDGIFRKVFAEDSALARSRSTKHLLWGLLSTTAYYGAFGWVLYLTVGGRLTLGEMTLYMALFRNCQGSSQGLLDNVNSLYENGLFLNNLFDFLGLKAKDVVRKQARRLREDPARGLEFRGVSFRYPGREAWALQDLSLAVRPGEKLALVGENGAGKTTLIKLLCGLYEPTQGRILVNGLDLASFAREEVHQRVGAIFQDFVHYHLPLRENIAFGAVERLGDEERVLAAARKGGADEVAKELPKGYDTVLGRWFDSGHELSGGQWQKVALSRAFMSDRDILVLDEPTSSLDAQAEYRVFRQFKELTEGRIAILISHRFSTVRMADRVAVLREGRLAELGSHAELMRLGGQYATLFELQAQGYR